MFAPNTKLKRYIRDQSYKSKFARRTKERTTSSITSKTKEYIVGYITDSGDVVRTSSDSGDVVRTSSDSGDVVRTSSDSVSSPGSTPDPPQSPQTLPEKLGFVAENALGRIDQYIKDLPKKIYITDRETKVKRLKEIKKEMRATVTPQSLLSMGARDRWYSERNSEALKKLGEEEKKEMKIVNDFLVRANRVYIEF